MKCGFLVLTSILLVSNLTAAADTCHSIFSFSERSFVSKSYPITELVMDGTKIPQGDSFTSLEHRENFWNIHERFGFVSEAGNTYLLAKTPKIFDHILQHLRDAKYALDGGSVGDKITQGKNRFPDLGEGKGILADVTSLIPSKFAGLNEYYPSRNGPNCWNLALYLSKVNYSLHQTLPQEFKFLIESPLAKKLTSVDPLAPGDVLVFRNGEEEVHTAIFLSPDLVLTKNGTDETRPYRIMELNEMAAQYLNPHPVFEMKLSDRWFVVRLSPLDKYVADNQEKIPAKILAAFKELKSLEETINASMLPDAKTSISKNEVRELVKAFHEKHRSNLEAENDFLATTIQMRLKSLLAF